jgi:anti-anti-sigma regulatory factor
MASQPRRLFKRYFQDILFLGSMLGRWGMLRLSPGGASRRPPPPDPELLAKRGAVLHSLGREGRVPAPEASSVVLDLSGRVWLDSDLLGAMVDLGRRCRARGGRLFLTGRAPRVDRLLRWCRLERYLELPDSVEELLQRLDRLADPAQAARIVTSGERLQIVLPEELDGGAADRLRPLFEAEWKGGILREVVVEGSHLEYLDTAGARFLRDAHQDVVRTPGKSFWLRGFAERHLERLRRDGFDAITLDRRGRFRLDSDVPVGPHPSAGARPG